MTAHIADVLAVVGAMATVRCPYCHHEHKHRNVGPGLNVRAPGCGLYLNADDRARGYTFVITKGRDREQRVSAVA